MWCRSLIVSILASVSIGAANAALLIDWSPDTLGANAGAGIAQSDAQYLQQFRLTDATVLTGFAFYTENNGHIAAVGDQIYVTITHGPFENGKPPASPIYYFLPVIVTSNQFPGATARNYGHNNYGLTGIFAPLPSVQLAADTYWIAFWASTGFELLTGPNAPFNDPMPQLDTNGKYGLSNSAPVGTMAMRLYGDVAVVSEPGTLALLAGCVGLFGLVGRRRQSVESPESR